MNPSFTYESLPSPADMARTPSRPLGAYSTFVCETLPDLCLSIERGVMDATDLPRAIEQAISTITADVRDFTRDESMLPFLDAGMGEAAVGRFKLIPPDNLARLTDDLAIKAGQTPGLRYESLIRGNPLDTDPRLFSSTQQNHGKGELLFYHTHLCIEYIAADAIQTLRSIMQRLQSPVAPNGAVIATDIGSLSVAADSIRDHLQLLISELPIEDFNAVRAYYNNETRNAAGPSGKDSAGIFVLDALTAGDDPELRQFLDSKMQTRHFYPTTNIASDHFTGQADMLEAMQSAGEGKTLVSLCKSFPALAPAISHFLKSKFALRARHIAVAKYFLPDAFKAGATSLEGTGGIQNLSDYLQIPAHILKRMKQS